MTPHERASLRKSLRHARRSLSLREQNDAAVALQQVQDAAVGAVEFGEHLAYSERICG